MFFCATMLAASAFGQITIAPYSPKISCQVDALSAIEAPQASSLCGTVTTKMSAEIFSGGCLGTEVRTYTYTDSCGNRAEAQLFISLKDNLEPELIGAPADIILKKGQPAPPAVEVSSRDNSGQIYEVVFEEKKMKDEVIRIWTCTDSCGNTAKHTQTIKWAS